MEDARDGTILRVVDVDGDLFDCAEGLVGWRIGAWERSVGGEGILSFCVKLEK